MKLLAIDTSTNYLSIAVTNGDKVLAKFHRRADMSHSTLLVPMIDKVLKKARLKIKDIDGFCVSIGPGSFTGLRIGVTTVKGLAYALKKPIVTVPTLDAIAYNGRKFAGLICPALDAKKNKVYACIYKSDGKKLKRASKYLLLGTADLIRIIGKREALFLGDAKGIEGIRDKDWHPRAQVVARLGLENFRKKRFVKPEDLEPMYIYSRECDIKGI